MTSPVGGFDVLVAYVPREATEAVLAAVFAAGAGALGDYSGCAFVSEGEGRFTPLAGATPYVGAVGRSERVPEHRVEVVVPDGRREAVVAALLAAHPYETPAWHLVATVR